ncbi:MAG: tetratricopeptide repeat protein, partial [Candidatus Sumerlaeota bacterium]|nr:tetratricopeptide repeat protein [Candidatus Sumerlaeota bacterium]
MMNIARCMSVVLCVAWLTGCVSVAWKDATSANTIAAYEEFLKKYPQSQYGQEACQKLEELYFYKAKTTNTIQSYEEFLKRCRHGPLSREAENKLEEFYFEKAKNADTIEAYEEFLKRYPDRWGASKFGGEPQKRIEKLCFEKAKSANTIEAYEDFLKKYSHGKFSDEALEMLRA